MKDELFYKLWKDALEQEDEEMYVAEYGYPEWFDEISTEPEKAADVLRDIHKAAHMSVREIIASAGMTQPAFACRFCIPLRTVENWAVESRKCPDYQRLAFCRELKILDLGGNGHE